MRRCFPYFVDVFCWCCRCCAATAVTATAFLLCLYLRYFSDTTKRVHRIYICLFWYFFVFSNDISLWNTHSHTHSQFMEITKRNEKYKHQHISEYIDAWHYGLISHTVRSSNHFLIIRWENNWILMHDTDNQTTTATSTCLKHTCVLAACDRCVLHGSINNNKNSEEYKLNVIITRRIIDKFRFCFCSWYRWLLPAHSNHTMWHYHIIWHYIFAMSRPKRACLCLCLCASTTVFKYISCDLVRSMWARVNHIVMHTIVSFIHRWTCFRRV